MRSGGMAVQTDPYTFTNGTVADANEVNLRFTRLYTLQNAAIDSTNMNMTLNYTWTGIHTFDAAEIRIEGAGAGMALLQYDTSATSRTFTIPDAGAAAYFVMTEGDQTINGNKTFSSFITPTVTTADNAATMVFNIPVTGTDATSHTIYFNIDGNNALSISATGDGAGSVGVRTVNIGVSGAADIVHIGDANALVDIIDAHWSITEAGVLSIVSMGANWTNAGITVADAGILTTVDINGGTIDGTTIGGSTAAAGTFTSATVSGAGAGKATIQYANSANNRTITIPDTGASSGVLLDEHFPIGSFLMWSDYNATLPMPNSTIWHCCDGQAIADASSPLNGITPLDMTGRYLVGFTTGVEGDGSIDLAGNTNAAAVGNAAHQIDLSGLAHDHGALGVTASGSASVNTTSKSGSVTSHSGNSGNENAHTHSGPSHQHGVGTLQFKVLYGDFTLGNPVNYYAYDINGNQVQIGEGGSSTGAPTGNNADFKNLLADADFYTASGSGSVAAGGTETTGAGSTHLHTIDHGHSDTLAFTVDAHTHDINHTHASAGGGSATQTIQPRSVQCRIYVRKR